MINGIDLLFLVVGLILLFLVWHLGDKYTDWVRWDAERRHLRMQSRITFNELKEEAEYRQELKRWLLVWVLTLSMIKLKKAADEATVGIREFGRRLSLISGGENVGIESGDDYPDPQYPASA